MTLFVGIVIVVMFVGAMNAKALTPSLALVIGLEMVYPDEAKALLLLGFYIPAVIMSNFRD